MKKNILLYLLIALFSIGIVYASGEHDFTEAKQLINAKTSCNELTEDQLEHIGDYYMEQMHPGEAHETMDEMMGGEGSESLRQMHIAIAKRQYCNDISGMTDYGMGGMMMSQGRTGSGFGSGMMGSGFGTGIIGYRHGFFGWTAMIVFWAFIIWLVLWIFNKNRTPGNPLKILKERYAKGEISKKQFENMKKELR
jgi:uncharacterized membrane protein